jgi:uncharacterized protein
MSDYEPRAILLEVFDRLRRSDFGLGVGELLPALRAVEGGWGMEGPEALRELARLLWCHSPDAVADFEEVFSAVLALDVKPAPEPALPQPPPDHPPPPQPKVKPPLAPPPAEPPHLVPEPAPLPVRSPVRLPPIERGPELRPYWPLSRRSMVYAWRHLRRTVKEGPRDVLDVAATIEQTARQGFFLYPVYDRRAENRTRMVLLIDQGGSMVPFHRFTRDLVETACNEQESQIRQVELAYFQNVPPAHVFRDPHLTQPVLLEQLLAGIDPDTSVLLVSDAGAARGYRRNERIRATAEFGVCLAGGQKTTLFSTPQSLKAYCRRSGVSDRVSDVFVS